MKYRTFQPQFHAPIRAGIKRSTIRNKPWCTVGDRIALRYWTGKAYRSPMGVIGTAVVDQVVTVSIGPWNVVVEGDPFIYGGEALAIDEGFESAEAMRDWFQRTHGLPYTGTLTRWDPSTLELAQSPQDGVEL